MLELLRLSYRINAKFVLKNRNVRHSQASLIYSQEDLVTNEFLVDLSGAAIRSAWENTITVRDTELPDSQYYNVFPGEHYRLLKALVSTLALKSVVEIGTYTGMGTLALSQAASDCVVSTFDIIKWDELETHLIPRDFETGKIVQHLGDLSRPAVFKEHFDLLNAADMIFIDAPKNGVFEYEIMDLLTTLEPRPTRLLVLDDIRFVNMIDLWRDIRSPKMDMSAFGHWSGTGLVDASEGLKLA